MLTVLWYLMLFTPCQHKAAWNISAQIVSHLNKVAGKFWMLTNVYPQWSERARQHAAVWPSTHDVLAVVCINLTKTPNLCQWHVLGITFILPPVLCSQETRQWCQLLAWQEFYCTAHEHFISSVVWWVGSLEFGWQCIRYIPWCNGRTQIYSVPLSTIHVCIHIYILLGC